MISGGIHEALPHGCGFPPECLCLKAEPDHNVPSLAQGKDEQFAGTWAGNSHVGGRSREREHGLLLLLHHLGSGGNLCLRRLAEYGHID
jgi:hypothetical protein